MNSLQHALGRSGRAAKPMHLCPNCGDCVLTATWSERLSERCVRDVWSCRLCGYEFETSAYLATKKTEEK